MIIVLRLLHIVLGALWVGMFFFMMFFLMPAIQEAGPSGGSVIAGLQRRRLMVILPVFAITTLISGFWLYWIVSGGFTGPYVHSTMGRTLALGGLFAILAFVVGIAIYRPAMVRVGSLAQSLATANEADRAAGNAELARLRSRTVMAGRAIAILLLLTVAMMAVARYL